MFLKAIDVKRANSYNGRTKKEHNLGMTPFREMVREELAKKGKKGLQIRPMLEGEKGGCEEHWEGNGVREEVSYA